MDSRIENCETLAQLGELETELGSDMTFLEHQQIFERRTELIQRVLEWAREHRAMGLIQSIGDSWTPMERQRFLDMWKDDEPLRSITFGSGTVLENMMTAWTDEQRARFEHDWDDDTGLFQMGRGEKRAHDEVNDDAGPSDEVRDNFFTVTNLKQVKVKKFNTVGSDYTVQFANTFADLELSEYHTRLHEIFESLLETVTEGVPLHDQVRFVLRSPQLETPISLPFMSRQRLTTERVLAEIERVIQSNHEFRLNDSVHVNLIHVEMPNGGTGTKRSEINLEKHLAKKGSIIRIQNTDEICLARALVVAIAKIENDSRYYHIIDSRRPLQKRLAHDLHQKARVEIGSCGLDKVKQFQTYLADYQINIVSKEHQNSIIFSGPEKDKMFYLFLHDNHYDVITSMPAFFVRKRYCHTCKKGYDKVIDHSCPDACKLCYLQNCPIVSWIGCGDCKRNFKSQECFDRHKQTVGNAKSVCASLIKCPDCHTVVKRGRMGRHHCGLTRCSTCKEYVHAENHQCYMQPEKERNTTVSEDTDFLDTEAHDGDDAPQSGYNELLFFDFECRQENGNHEPNLCVVQNEAGDEWVFEGDNTRNEFCEWLFTKEHAGCIVLAHNFQGYDSYFILQYLHENGVIPEVIMRGAKVLTLSVPKFNIKFIDSLSFIPMRLADFPTTFGLDELAKGYFPHLFNRKENKNYVGHLPPSQFYNPDGMSPEEMEKFLEWHNGLRENNYVFDFQQEILTYCRSDVDILRRCCLEFRELFRDVTDIDPFEKCLTIASACNLVFRKNFLKENTIAIIPPHGYRPKDKQSLLALKWLSYKAEKEDLYIQHARNTGEKRAGNYLLDGYDEETNTAYEINGCFWHGKLT
jgi:hypothetical protein